jgi:hypothetical protein
MSSWLLRSPTGNSRNQNTYVTVELCGGLANRIFQILAAQGFAEKTGRKFVLVDDYIVDNPHQTKESTMNELNIFFKDLPLYSGETREWVPITEEHYMYYTYNLELLHRHKGKNIILKGYFQNEHYFPRQVPTIEGNPKINTYFLHLRFGDYINTPHDVGLALYYRKAIQNILITNQLSSFIVFSNEPDRVDEYIQNQIQYPIRYSISHAGTPLAVLKEMAECSGGICANSSLSYLGGYLQRKPRGKIFMPDIWMTTVPKKQMAGFYPPWATVYTIRDVPLGSRDS